MNVCAFFVGDNMDKYMELALKLARKALKYGDIPVAAVIIENGKVISKAYNIKYKTKDVTAHAEIVAIRKACKKKKTTYLNDCVMYVTLEPCMMCSAAITQSHIKEVIYCLDSPKYGFFHNISGKNGVKCTQMYNKEYEMLLKSFFKDKR